MEVTELGVQEDDFNIAHTLDTMYAMTAKIYSVETKDEEGVWRDRP